ncbi:MAG: transporter substrate-binding domain-containing protein [Actinomycetota bacterium]|nr:transporter substrate-binding domain-containing protein [Actinomycetota bacterium]
MRSIRIAAVLAATMASALLVSCAAPAPEPEPEPTEAASTLFDELPEAIQDAGEIVFTGDIYAPYRVQEGDKVTGWDPELQELLAAELGVDIRFESAGALPAMLTGIQSGRYDAFNGPLRATAEREAEFDMVVYMTTVTSYVFLEGKDIESSDDVCGLRVAGIAGAVTEGQVLRLSDWCVAEGEPAIEFVGLADNPALVLAVNSDRADAFATTETSAIDVTSKNPGEFEYVKQTEEQGAGIDLLGLVVAKDTGLGDVMLKAMQNLYASGAFPDFMDEWGFSAVMLDEPALNPNTQ